MKLSQGKTARPEAVNQEQSYRVSSRPIRVKMPFSSLSLIVQAICFSLLAHGENTLADTTLEGFLDSKNSPIDVSHPFTENLNKTFTWSDPSLQALLWGSEDKIEKDDNVETAHRLIRQVDDDDAIILPNCLFCLDQDRSVPQLSDFSGDKMMNFMIQPIRWDVECSFYAQRSRDKIPPYMSGIATRWACSNDMRTIWVRIR